MHDVTKCIVFILLFLYLASASWSVMNIKIGAHPTDLLPKSSYAIQSLEAYRRNVYLFGDNLHIWCGNLEKYSTDMNFWFKTSLDSVSPFNLTKYSFFVDYWWDRYKFFASASIQLENETFRQSLGWKGDSNDFEKNAKKFAELVQHVVAGTVYEKDVYFTKNEKTGAHEISAVRFMVRLCNVTSVNHYAATHHFRQIAKDVQLKCHAYHPFFEFGDQFDSIVPSLFGNMGYGSMAVVVVCLLLIPKPMCAVWVSITIISINVGVLGFMSKWGVHLDFVSMVTIVMSVGSSVNFSAHIAYHFAKTQLPRVKDRVRDSLYVVATPILQSAFSTWLGIMLITIIDSYTFRAFVKTASLVILFGLLHGLVILPVFLSVFNWKKSLDEETSSVTADVHSVDEDDESKSKTGGSIKSSNSNK